uniref:Rab-GAP TBC domain-containing protein n=1 Tax=Syphacia muris TaxID=451379 RepID=A0A0N5AT23_9BILA
LQLVIADLKSSKEDCKDDQGNVVDGAEYHWEVVERILFIYSKLNPGVKYGMNEIVGPLYYVFATDRDKDWAQYAEADTYYCFQILMSEIKDNFIKMLDNSNCGISWSMNQFCELLRGFDVELYNHLVVDLCIKPQFFAFRWISLLLSQEFSLPDVIIIWDSIFSSESRIKFLHFVCIAMMEREREELLNGDFSSCLRLLQNIPEKNVYELLRVAFDIRDGNYKLPLSNSVDDGSRKFKFDSANRFAAAFANSFRNLTKK